MKCGFGQKLCHSGVDKDQACRWPNVAATILGAIPSTKQGRTIVENMNFKGETTDAQEYAKWLGSKHEQRVWGEPMSNASALIIRFCVERANKKAGTDAVGEEGSAIDVVALAGHSALDTSEVDQLAQTSDQGVVARVEHYNLQDGNDADTRAYRKNPAAQCPVPAYNGLLKVCKKTDHATALADMTYSQRRSHRPPCRVSPTKQLQLLIHSGLNHV
jgi:hypothetical protein